METIIIEINTTVEGEEKTKELELSVPENLAEATREWGKEETYSLALRMFKLDKSNAERVVLRGGEAKAKRSEASKLAKVLLADPELMERYKKEVEGALAE